MPETGMDRAIISSSKSAASSPAPPDNTGRKQRRATWGGARNRRDRTSDCLSCKQATGIMSTAQTATAIGLPLNRHITIHWERAGVPDSEAAAATGRFLKLASDWVRSRACALEKQSKEFKSPAVSADAKKSSTFAWLWVRENDDGDGSKGSHVHILCHVPAGVKLGRTRRWLSRVTGRRYRKGSILTERIGGKAQAAATAPAVYQANLAEIVGYLLKGASPDAARALGLNRIEAGGRITGKRAGWSQNIGAAAQTLPKTE